MLFLEQAISQLLILGMSHANVQKILKKYYY